LVIGIENFPKFMDVSVFEMILPVEKIMRFVVVHINAL